MKENLIKLNLELIFARIKTMLLKERLKIMIKNLKFFKILELIIMQKMMKIKIKKI